MIFMEGMPASDVPQPVEVDGVVVYSAQKGWAIGQRGPCLIVVWRGAVTQEPVLQINELLWTLSQQHPGNCAYMNVIEQSSTPPPAWLRKIVMEGVARPGKALSCAAVAIEGNELRSAFVRAIMTGLTLLRRQSQPMKFFKNTREMSVWVKSQLKDVGDLDQDIVRAAEVLRGQMPQ